MTERLQKFVRKKYSEGLSTYCDIMVEISRRMDNVMLVLNGVWPMDPRMAEDFSYANLRMICELISIGCLFAHADLDAARNSLKKVYQADAIIRAMAKLHPNFYPNPCHIDAFGTVRDWEQTDGEFLTKELLIDLYIESHDYLHVGSIKRFPRLKTREPNLPNILVWHWRIIRLLNTHRISLIDPHLGLLVRMKAAETGEVPTATISVFPDHPLLKS